MELVQIRVKFITLRIFTNLKFAVAYLLMNIVLVKHWSVCVRVVWMRAWGRLTTKIIFAAALPQFCLTLLTANRILFDGYKRIFFFGGWGGLLYTTVRVNEESVFNPYNVEGTCFSDVCVEGGKTIGIWASRLAIGTKFRRLYPNVFGVKLFNGAVSSTPRWNRKSEILRWRLK